MLRLRCEYMIASQLKRIETLEKLCTQEPLIVLACTDTGDNVKVSMKECIKQKYTFLKVVSGSSLDDLDLLFKKVETDIVHNNSR